MSDDVSALVLSDFLCDSLSFYLGVVMRGVLAVSLAEDGPAIGTLYNVLVAHFVFSLSGKGAR